MKKTRHSNIKISKVVKGSLDNCQVQTSPDVISFFWTVVHKYRKNLGLVIDLGAGDGKFSIKGKYKAYTGVEIDKTHLPVAEMPNNAKLEYGCALDVKKRYDASVGNPPYFRHHAIHPKWRKKASELIKNKTGVRVNELCNLFVYFLWLSISITKQEGIIAVIIPYEWVSRPSTKSLRDYITKKRWAVDVYSFVDSKKIFPSVITTASITVIDKSRVSKNWGYFDVDSNFKIRSRNGKIGNGRNVLPYIKGGTIRAQRGFSPGSQKIFTLTEGERIHHGIRRTEVVPCVTSLRKVPSDMRVLNKKYFNRYFVDAGQKCWLLKTDVKLRTAVIEYLKNSPQSEKNSSTCKEREVWYEYTIPKIPKILYSSGFVHVRPKVVHNAIGAVSVGSVHGVIENKEVRNVEGLVDYLCSFNFESRIVPHARKLKKVEVKQMNWVITQYYKKKHPSIQIYGKPNE